MKMVVLVAVLAGFVPAFAAGTSSAGAAYADVGLLSDVSEIRAEFERHGPPAADLYQVIVRGDWAHLSIGYKGAYFLDCRRHGKTWCRSYQPDGSGNTDGPLPKDFSAFCDLIAREGNRVRQ